MELLREKDSNVFELAKVSAGFFEFGTKNDFSSSSSSSSFSHSNPQQQSKREQITEIAGKAQAKVQELVGEAKK